MSTKLVVHSRKDPSPSPTVQRREGWQEGARRVSTSSSVKNLGSADLPAADSVTTSLSNLSLSRRSYVESIPGVGVTFESSMLEGYEKVAKKLLKEMREADSLLSLEQLWLAIVLENTHFTDNDYQELENDVKNSVIIAANMLGRMELIERLNRLDEIPVSEVIRPMIVSPDMDLVTARNAIGASISKWGVNEGDFIENDEPCDISVVEGARYLQEEIERLKLEKVRVIDIHALRKKNLKAIDVEVSVGNHFEILTSDITLFTKLPSLTRETRKLNETEIRELLEIGFATNYEVYNISNLVLTQTCVYIVETHPTRFCKGPHPMEEFFSLKNLALSSVPFDRILAETYVKYYSLETVKAIEAREDQWVKRIAGSYLLGRNLKIEIK